MLRIAIVEDDRKCVELIQEYIESYQAEKQVRILTKVYQDGLSFISEYTADCDLVLMDIEMPHMNGLDAARKLRQLDSQVCLIFITNMAQYAINGYEVQALDFMVKPVGYFNFSLKLDKVMRICRQQEKEQVFVPTEEGTMRLPISDIIYLESYKHYLFIHTENGEYKIRSTMSEFLEKLNDNHFCCCSKSYCVNLEYVSSFRGDSVTVSNQIINVSRSYKKLFLDKMTTYINRGGN